MQNREATLSYRERYSGRQYSHRLQISRCTRGRIKEDSRMRFIRGVSGYRYKTTVKGSESDGILHKQRKDPEG